MTKRVLRKATDGRVDNFLWEIELNIKRYCCVDQKEQVTACSVMSKCLGMDGKDLQSSSNSSLSWFCELAKIVAVSKLSFSPYEVE